MRLTLHFWVLLGAAAGCSNAAVEMDSEAMETGGGGTSQGPSTSGEADPTVTDVSSLPPATDSSLSEIGSEVGTAPDPSSATMEILTGGTTGTTGPDIGESTSLMTTATEDDSSTGSPLDGCGVAAEEGAQDRMIEVAGAQRHYIVVIPAGYDANKPYPVVFAWHGLGGSGMLARAYFGIEMASQGEAILVYPDGLPLPAMGNQTGWDLADGGVDVQFFDAMLAELGTSACIDASRVFSAGHSFGGYMSNSLGCFRGGTVRAIAPVAGGGPFGACTGQVAAWLAHGTLDAVVPFTQGTDSRDHWADANGCGVQADPIDPPPCTAFVGCDAGFPVHWCEHDEADFMGHGWPSWAGAGIWQFFAGL